MYIVEAKLEEVKRRARKYKPADAEIVPEEMPMINPWLPGTWFG